MEVSQCGAFFLSVIHFYLQLYQISNICSPVCCIIFVNGCACTKCLKANSLIPSLQNNHSIMFVQPASFLSFYIISASWCHGGSALFLVHMLEAFVSLLCVSISPLFSECFIFSSSCVLQDTAVEIVQSGHSSWLRLCKRELPHCDELGLALPPAPDWVMLGMHRISLSHTYLCTCVSSLYVSASRSSCSLFNRWLHSWVSSVHRTPSCFALFSSLSYSSTIFPPQRCSEHNESEEKRIEKLQVEDTASSILSIRSALQHSACHGGLGSWLFSWLSAAVQSLSLRVHGLWLNFSPQSRLAAISSSLLCHWLEQ